MGSLDDEAAFHRRFRQGRIFPRQVVARVAISAPAPRVWEILVDLPRYREWNPFTQTVEGELRVGRPVVLHVSLLARKPILQREWVNRIDPGRLLCWGTRLGHPALLTANRWQVVEPDGEAACLYRTEDRFSGWLVPLVFGLYGRRMQGGFEAMAAALKARAEASTPAANESRRT